jgi:FMN phosphatase YigB (HAD superfamily)
MVGDNLDADIRGAKNAGLYAVWISRRAGPSGDDQPRVQPDATVGKLTELPALLDYLQVQ